MAFEAHARLPSLGELVEWTMPQVIVLVLTGAGLYAGYRWVSREVRRALAAAAEAHDGLKTEAAKAAGVPKDLGPLEWDEKAGVYRPSRQVGGGL